MTDNKIEFKNGSYIMGIDLASGNDFTIKDGKVIENSRGNRSKLVEFNFRMKDLIPSDYKWYQRLRLRLLFILDDIKYYLWDRWTR